MENSSFARTTGQEAQALERLTTPMLLIQDGAQATVSSLIRGDGHDQAQYANSRSGSTMADYSRNRPGAMAVTHAEVADLLLMRRGVDIHHRWYVVPHGAWRR